MVSSHCLVLHKHLATYFYTFFICLCIFPQKREIFISIKVHLGGDFMAKDKGVKTPKKKPKADKAKKEKKVYE